MFAKLLQHHPGICVCSASKADHRGITDIHQPPMQSFAMQRAEPHHPVVPGHIRPMVNPGPVTHSYQLPQPSQGSSNAQRNLSIVRAATRNRGGIPSPVVRAVQPQRVQGRSGRAQQPVQSKLMIAYLPLYVSLTALFGCIHWPHDLARWGPRVLSQIQVFQKTL